jgi:hypothetical protein
MGNEAQIEGEVVAEKTAIAKTEPPNPPASGLWRPGKDGGYVDLSRQEARAMLSMPAELTSMVPEVAADFVAMLGSVETVKNDGEVRARADKGGGVLFRYPTAGAIIDAARKHLSAHGFVALFPGGYEWHKTHQVVSMSLSLMHKTGVIIPMAKSVMPCLGADTKAVCCTVTELRKYMLGLALNMSWNDQTEDAVLRRERAGNGNGNGQVRDNPPQQQRTHQQAPMTTERKTYPAEQAKRETAVVMPYRGWLKDEYEELLSNTKLALKSMKEKGFSPLETYFIATGTSLNAFPKLPFPSVCDGIILAALIASRHDPEKLKGLDLDGLRNLAGPDDPLPYAMGKITSFGTESDKKFMRHEPKSNPAEKTKEPDDNRKPPPGWDAKNDEPPADDDIPF